MQVVRIAITGPESSGKTALALELGALYHAPVAEERARAYLEAHDGAYTQQDLDTMCALQVEEENAAIRKATGICFFDTDMTVFKVWSEHKYGRCSSFIQQQYARRTYDVHLLCTPDLPWQADPLRECAPEKERWEIFDKYQHLLNDIGANYTLIEGEGASRRDGAVSFLCSEFKHHPNFFHPEV